MNLVDNNNRVMSEKNHMRAYLECIQYRVARTRNELEQAYALVHNEYLKKNYENDNKSGLHLSEYNLLPENTTFIALADDEILATASVILDTCFGLPMDDLYKPELDILRKGNKLCEISMLAINNSIFKFKEGTPLLLNPWKMFLVYYLFKYIFDYTIEYLNLDYICIAINPKHEMTYDNLLFKDLGGLKSYAKVNGAPALGKCLNLKTVKEDCARINRSKILYQLFFSREIDHESFSGKIKLSLEDIEYFFVNKSDILLKMSPEKIGFLEELYPGYDFAKIIPNIKEAHSY
ncbi:MAG: hypothetical protein HQL24_07555 [Candidatus Omnitrophica bacterium]|nr:hypothetical protein [Candidatus Omnitrophota bacterium]